VTALRFDFEGRAVTAREGQSIGAALLAAGVRTLSWSAKYRRPRGLRCCRGACPCCQVRVDGIPGVTACMTPIRGGERVERERPAARALPADRLGRFTPAGFYYGAWLGRPSVWPRAERVLATLAGVSRPPAAVDGMVGSYEERVVDLLVVGGGERGLLAATATAAAGRRVLLCERDSVPGGRLLDLPGGAARAAQLLADATAAGVEVRVSTIVLGASPDSDGAWAVSDARGLTVVETATVELATGTLDREISLPDGDRPGVLLAGAARRLIIREGVVPGRRVVVVATGEADGMLEPLLRDAGIVTAASCAPCDIVAIEGRDHVRAVKVAGRRVACDLVVIDAGTRPEDGLERQASVLAHPRGSAAPGDDSRG